MDSTKSIEEQVAQIGRTLLTERGTIDTDPRIRPLLVKGLTQIRDTRALIDKMTAKMRENPFCYYDNNDHVDSGVISTCNTEAFAKLLEMHFGMTGYAQTTRAIADMYAGKLLVKEIYQDSVKTANAAEKEIAKSARSAAPSLMQRLGLGGLSRKIPAEGARRATGYTFLNMDQTEYVLGELVQQDVALRALAESRTSKSEAQKSG